MKKIISKAFNEEVCKGYIFLDCAIRANNIVYVLARLNLTIEEASDKNDYDIPTRVITLLEQDDSADLLIGAAEVDNFDRPVLGISQQPKSQALLAANDRDGTILPFGGGQTIWSYEVLQKNALPGCK